MLSEREKYLIHLGFNAAARHPSPEKFIDSMGDLLHDEAPPSDRTVRRIFAKNYARTVELMPTKQQNEILGIMRKASEPVRTPAIAKALGVSIPHANVQLLRLINSGYLVRYERPKVAGGIEYRYEIAKE